MVPRRVEGGNALEAEAGVHRPRPRARDSLLAGLERGTGVGRVDAWRRFVEV